MDDLRFPVGKFVPHPQSTPQQRQDCIRQIAEAPAAMQAAVARLSEHQLDTPYRPGGWTIRQVVHHMPDSHLNAYCRFKLALTEDNPTIKPYDEAAWANIADTKLTPVDVSLTLYDSLHRRWVILMESMAASDFARPLMHPERGAITLDWMLQLYAWHGRHHAAHVTELRRREGW